jgi:hypothetical protein
MNNVHPLFKTALAPITPRMPAKGTRPFAVRFTIGAEVHDLNVIAFTSCDAICMAIDIFFDGEDNMPVDGMKVDVHPMNFLPAAA